MLWMLAAYAGTGEVKTGLKQLDGKEYGMAATSFSRALEGELADKWKLKALLGRGRARARMALMKAPFSTDQAIEAAEDFAAAGALGAEYAELIEVVELGDRLHSSANEAKEAADQVALFTALGHLRPSDPLPPGAACIASEDSDPLEAVCHASIERAKQTDDPKLWGAKSAWRLSQAQAGSGGLEATRPTIESGLALIAQQRERSGDPSLGKTTEVNLLTTWVNLTLKADDAAARRTAVDRLLAADPDHAFGHYLSGDLHLQQGEEAKAKEELERAIELDSKQAQFHYALGALLTNASNGKPASETEEPLKKALGHFRTCAELEPAKHCVEGMKQVAAALDDTEAYAWAKEKLEGM